MNIFYKYAAEYKVLRNKLEHHITISTLLFWVWKPPEKPKMGKPVQQSDIDFIMRKYGTFTITANHPNLVKQFPNRITGQTPAKTLPPFVWSYSQMYGLPNVWISTSVQLLYEICTICTEYVLSVRPSSATTPC